MSKPRKAEAPSVIVAPAVTETTLVDTPIGATVSVDALPATLPEATKGETKEEDDASGKATISSILGPIAVRLFPADREAARKLAEAKSKVSYLRDKLTAKIETLREDMGLTDDAIAALASIRALKSDILTAEAALTSHNPINLDSIVADPDRRELLDAALEAIYGWTLQIGMRSRYEKVNREKDALVAALATAVKEAAAA